MINTIIDFSLPDMWEMLSRTDRPIVLYGTGNGADKILDIFEARNIKAGGVFASDGFVRDRYFRGMKVMSRAEAEERFGDFIAVISFASSLPEVMANMCSLRDNHITVAPDVPVYGGGLCDRSWFEEYGEQLSYVRSLLCDGESVRIFDSVLKYRYTGDISFLTDNVSSPDALGDILDYGSFESCCDLGAYNGDTIREILARCPGIGVTAMEPDARSFRKLSEYCAEYCPQAKLYNAAAWNEETVLSFSAGGGRGTSSSAKNRKTEVRAFPPDSVIEGNCSYIKYDVEGSEAEALEGTALTIKRCSPALCVSLYHRCCDIFSLPMRVKEMNGGYRFYMRRFPYIPAWDLNLYAVHP